MRANVLQTATARVGVALVELTLHPSREAGNWPEVELREGGAIADKELRVRVERRSAGARVYAASSHLRPRARTSKHAPKSGVSTSAAMYASENPKSAPKNMRGQKASRLTTSVACVGSWSPWRDGALPEEAPSSSAADTRDWSP